MRVDLSNVPNPHTRRNRIERALWGVVYALLFRLSPPPLHGWRRMLLRLFGAQIGEGARIYPSAEIWYPRNLRVGKHARIAQKVFVYNIGPVEIGDHSIVSRGSYLCPPSHDIQDVHFRMTFNSLRIGNGVWIATEAFVGPNVVVGDGAVVGARAAVFKDVAPGTIVGGNPARVLGTRTLTPPPSDAARPRGLSPD